MDFIPTPPPTPPSELEDDDVPPAPEGPPPELAPIALEDLIPAVRGHLDIGQILFVRDRRAVVIDVEYPIVYWRFVDEDVVKHRNFLYSTHMFKVPKDTPIIQHRLSVGSSFIDFTDSDSEDEDVDTLDFDAAFLEDFEDDFGIDENKSGEADTNSTLQSKILLVDRQGDEEMYLELAIRSRGEEVVIQNCQYVELIIEGRPALVTVANCKNVELRFASAVFGLEVEESSSSVLVWWDQCTDVRLDGCDNLECFFPMKQDVNIELAASAACLLNAVENPEGLEHSDDLDSLSAERVDTDDLVNVDRLSESSICWNADKGEFVLIKLDL